MRAGRLDRAIAVERASSVVNEYGATVAHWGPVATLRAQLIEATTDEFQRAYGASSETATVFRTRWLDGVTVADRVAYQGSHLGIVQVKEIGRRRGLELRCTRIGQGS
ncbi:phage head closure protein [Mesorhizobium sp. CN2-181]|uniref:phage head closure protein n=1 Tax=Mesorhizobium yinganensis TaxID=3157707 RepID=UPI0032B80CF3